MKTLLILRHAKSSWKDEKLDDHDRPLNKRGQRDAPRMGKLLRKEDLLPDFILSSSARRARETIEAVVEESGYGGDIYLSHELYAFEPQPYLEALQQLQVDYPSVLLVGHNPALEGLVEMLTGESESLTTAALAKIELPIDGWQELTDETEGKLINIWRPRELGES